MSRVEERYAPICGDPILPCSGFNDVIDMDVRKPSGNCGVYETMAIEAGQTFVGTDPEELVRVAINAADVIMS